MFKWVQWLIANEFAHMRSFLHPLLDYEEIPAYLRERLERRLDTGIRLMKFRMLIYAVMFPALLGILSWMVVDALETMLGAAALEGVRAVLTVVLQVVSALFILSGIALLIVQRAILLCRVDAMILAIEVVTTGAKTGGPMPSSQYVKVKPP